MWERNLKVGGHSDSETGSLITAAGQRRTRTGLSPLRLVADPHQNRLCFTILTSNLPLRQAKLKKSKGGADFQLLVGGRIIVAREKFSEKGQDNICQGIWVFFMEGQRTGEPALLHG
jgi:hypothetical protein